MGVGAQWDRYNENVEVAESKKKEDAIYCNTDLRDKKVFNDAIEE